MPPLQKLALCVSLGLSLSFLISCGSNGTSQTPTRVLPSDETTVTDTDIAPIAEDLANKDLKDIKIPRLEVPNVEETTTKAAQNLHQAEAERDDLKRRIIMYRACSVLSNYLILGELPNNILYAEQLAIVGRYLDEPLLMVAGIEILERQDEASHLKPQQKALLTSTKQSVTEDQFAKSKNTLEAFREWRVQSDNGNTEAMTKLMNTRLVNLPYIHLGQEGGNPDPAIQSDLDAHYLCLQASAGSAPAIVNLAVESARDEKAINSPLSLLIIAAKMGSMKACEDLALIYQGENNEGSFFSHLSVNYNLDKAKAWIAWAAKLQSVGKLLNVEGGIDPASACRMFARQQGSYTTRKQKPSYACVEWSMLGARLGDAICCRDMAGWYEQGVPGINKDEQKAIFYYKKAARLGDPKSQQILFERQIAF